MIKRIICLSLVVLFGFATGICLAKYSGGDGTPANPYRISDANDMNDIGLHDEDWDKHFVMVNDIDLADYNYTTAMIAPDTDNLGYSFDGTPFTGFFDGNDHTLTGLTIDTGGVDNDFLGLFGKVGSGGEVKSLGVEDVNISGGDNSNALGDMVGANYGTISCCHSAGIVSSGIHSSDLGGLVGANYGGSIDNCYSTGDVSGENSLGGLVGKIDGGTLMNSYSTISVTGNSTLGGLVGGNGYGSIIECYSTGSVTGSYWVGGLVGLNSHDNRIENSYSRSSVTGENNSQCLGGLIGYNVCYSSFDSSILNCYSTGRVSGGIGSSGLGGLVGCDTGEDSYTSCFWDSDVNPDVNGIGNTTDPNVIGKSTVEMMTESTFTDWDFVEIWNIGENQTYPFLRVYPAGDLNHDGRVDGRDLAIIASRWLTGLQ